MTRMVVIGVDSSTQSTKVEARDLLTGELLRAASAPHPKTSPPTSEQDPLAWWEALKSAVSDLGDIRESVVAISVAAQQHGLVLTNELGQPLRKAQLWNDTTSAPQAARLVNEIGAQAWAEAIGSVPVAAFTITKLAWMAEHEPEILNSSAHIMLPHDWLTFKLTNSFCTDRGDASGSGWYSPSNDAVRSDLLELATGISSWQDRLPRVLAPDESPGTLTAAAANDLGLNQNVIVGPGTGDNMAGALGLGLELGDIAMSLGTSGTVYALSEHSTHDPSGQVAGFADATGNYLPLVCTMNATRVTDTVATWLGTDAPGLSELASNADPSIAGPMLIPHFDGERTPNRPDATGLLSDLTTSTTREQIALAAHDGVLCGLFNGLHALKASGVQSGGNLYLIGGGAHSAAYQQRCADLHGNSIVVPRNDETVATGAAVQASAVLDGNTLEATSKRWNLGAGSRIEPANDASQVMVRYLEALAK